MTKKSKKQFENQLQTGYMQNNEPQIVSGKAGKKNRIKTHSQSGRSMIEMLGVLAIIAILSIGGIVGYKLAMNYYQADQIANEINLMRNDLKVKYALGNEELLLGDPYDETPENEDYSGHLSTQYDRYPVDYDCIRKDKTEFYNCREADAYYIKVGNVSKGVCKPLTTLVNAMDGLMYIEINKEVYKENDLCSSDENNEFYIQFDAEDVNGNYDSNRPEGWCAKNEDCDASRPICDIENNECVECIDHTDCTDSAKPRCNIDLGNCESCPPEKPVWYNNTCVECETNEDCLMKGTENPICNTIEGKCKPCPGGQEWKESAQGCAAYECRTNEDCNPEGGFEKYCYYKVSTTNNCVCEDNEWDDALTQGGTCKPVNGAFGSIKASINNQEYVVSNESMTWWSACRLCAAEANTDDSNCVSPTMDTPSFMLDYSILQCTSDKQFFCYKTNNPHSDRENGQSWDIFELSDANAELSDPLNELRKTKCNSGKKAYDNTCRYHFWLNNNDSSKKCRVYGIDMDSGLIQPNSRRDACYAADVGGYAICVNHRH